MYAVYNKHYTLGPPLGDIDGVNQWGAIIGTRQSARQEFLVNIDQTSNNSALRWQNYKLYKGIQWLKYFIVILSLGFKDKMIVEVHLRHIM